MKHESYEEFVAKFNNKDHVKTTDDCYTPKRIMDAIMIYVNRKYGVPFEKMVRPFYPNGDYEKEDYTDCVVVDNPPFSIVKKIQRFYVKNGIKFFLFAPGLMLASIDYEEGVSGIFIKPAITYENGAQVATAFVTNLEPEPVLKRDEALSEAIRRIQHREPKHTNKSPSNSITAAKIKTYGGCYYVKDFYRPKKVKVFGSCLIPIGEEPKYEDT